MPKRLFLSAILVLSLFPSWGQPLTFSEFLKTVESNHPALKVADVERKTADAQLIERAGAFDPTLTGRTGERLFHSSSSLGKPSEVKEHEASLDFLTRWGAKASVGGRLARGDMKTPVSPTGRDGTLSYSLNVPLLRGAVANPRQASEKKAEIGTSSARAAYEERRLRLLVQASESYWKWAAATRKLVIEKDLLKNAEFRLAAISTRTAHGDLPRIARVEAEQEVWIRRGRWQKALRANAQSSFSLSSYLWSSDGNPSAIPEEVDLSTEPEIQHLSPADISKAEELALSRRPEPKGLEFTRQIAQVDRTLARNSLLPQLDALWFHGDDRGAGGIGPVRRIGLELSVPLFFRAGRGQIRQANFSLERLDWLERALKLRIVNEVRDAASALETDAQRLDAARQEASLASELERAERAAFELGDSTLFLVNQRERAAAEAATRYIEVRSDYEVSRVTFLAAQGDL